MARFVFELETLLEIRRREERERMRAVGELESERVEIERAGLEVEARAREERGLLRTELVPERRVDLPRVRTQAGASLHGFRKTRELALRAAAVERKLRIARDALLEATAKRRAVELLRERRFEAWQSEQRRLEGRELDDIVTARFGPGGRGTAA